MMTLRNGALALMFALVVLVPTASARAASIDEMLTMIQNLMAQIEELQKQLNTVRGEVKSVLKDGLREGMTDADIAKIQEILATDSTIYPEGMVTGYFGPLTKKALMRFQMRHGATSTGELDEETRGLLEEYLHEGFGDKIPPGLLRAPGIMKKVEMRIELGCDKKGKGGFGMGPLCKKYHADDEDGDDDSDDDDGDDSSDDNASSTDYNVEVEVEDGTTTVTFTLDTTDYEVVVHSTSKNTVLAAVADELNVTVSDLDADLVSEIKTDLENAISDAADAAETDAQNAIDDANDAINDAQVAIDAATGSTTDAVNLLEDAQNKVDDAENAFDDEDWAEAEALADEAKGLAEDAVDAL